MNHTDGGNILITMPSLSDLGGVASFYNAVLPHMPNKVIPLEIGGTKGQGSFLYPLIDQVNFRRAVNQENPSVVFINPSLNFKSFIRDGLFALQAKQKKMLLLVFWRGWDDSFETIIENQLSWFFHSTFARADCFIVLASEFRQKLLNWGVSVPIHLGSTTVEEQLLQHFDIDTKLARMQHAKAIKILFLARLEREKGIFETVQAVKLLLDKDLPVQLTIAGEGDIRQALETHTCDHGLDEQQVSFLGDIRGSDKISVLTEHHLYCFPSYYGEGLPNSVLEAMAFGMPVVTRPVGGLADIFEDGKMGHLVLGKSPEEIADCLEQLITDQDRMAEIAKYNARYAKKHFMAPMVAKRLLTIYDEMINNK